jgi:hypothetical protein
LRREQAAAYCKLSPSAFSQWVSQGRLPKPILGTARDLKAIDRAIDSLSGLNQASRPHWICRERNVRVVLQGIHKVKKRLASGDIKIHYCAWRDGPAIHAKPGTPRVGACRNDAHSTIRQPRAGTLMTIIAEYKAAPEFTRLAPSGRRAGPQGQRAADRQMRPRSV